MNLLPIAGFYWKHGKDLENKFSGAAAKPGEPNLILEIATAAVPILKRHRPDLNENNLLDDALSTLIEVLVPSTGGGPTALQG